MVFESSSSNATVVVSNSPPVLSTVNVDASGGVAAGMPLTCASAQAILTATHWCTPMPGATAPSNLDTRTLTTADDTYTVAQSAISQGTASMRSASRMVSTAPDLYPMLSRPTTLRRCSFDHHPNAGVTATTTLYCVPDYVSPMARPFTEPMCGPTTALEQPLAWRTA